jgi:hypothetical protein
MPDFISLAERAALLAVVDSEVPPGIEAVWLTGSRTRGQARQGSDWDVLVIHPDAPDDEYRVLAAGSFTHPGPDGNLINGFMVRQRRLDTDPRPYFADCRQFGIRLR